MKKRKKDSRVRVRFNINNMTIMNRGSREELLGSSQEALRNSQHDLRFSYEKPLTREEKTYLLHADRGDYATVKRLIDQYASNTEVLDINCVDPLNRSALIAAIENENIELIKLLLGVGIMVKDALLHAIKEEYVEAVEMLLQWEEQNHVAGEPYSWESVDAASATFTPDITPLILAAHRNHYEILKILLDRGATLPVPHDVKCGCDECVMSSQEDSLRHSQARINAYRALTSPSLIALSSADPLLTAFQLSWELGRLSRMETEFRVEYKALRQQCQEFATSLLDHTRTSKELEIMLNYNPWDTDTWEPGERQTLGRLKLAIQYKQKMFVAHPNVQQLLGAIWYEGLPGFKRKNIVGQCIQVAKLGVMFPVYCTIYMLAPNSEYGRFMKKPFVKFICHSSSYMLFLKEPSNLPTLLNKTNEDNHHTDTLGSSNKSFVDSPQLDLSNDSKSKELEKQKHLLVIYKKYKLLQDPNFIDRSPHKKTTILVGIPTQSKPYSYKNGEKVTKLRDEKHNMEIHQTKQAQHDEQIPKLLVDVTKTTVTTTATEVAVVHQPYIFSTHQREEVKTANENEETEKPEVEAVHDINKRGFILKQVFVKVEKGNSSASMDLQQKRIKLLKS